MASRQSRLIGLAHRSCSPLGATADGKFFIAAFPLLMQTMPAHKTAVLAGALACGIENSGSIPNL
jgi:hypothetical protein